MPMSGVAVVSDMPIERRDDVGEEDKETRLKIMS